MRVSLIDLGGDGFAEHKFTTKEIFICAEVLPDAI